MAVPVNPRYGSGPFMAHREIAKAGYSLVVYMPNALGKAMATSITESTRHITQALSAGLSANVFTAKDLRTANLEIANKAQEAVRQGWRARLPLKSGPYRRGSDPDKSRLSGRLGETLASESMVQGTNDRGISFLNTTVLAENARHWYRVNYGAYGHNVPSIRRPKAYPVTMDGHTIFTIQDENEPAANSWLPRRFSFQNNEFVPHLGPADKEGGGHRAALFTDLGWKALAEGVEPSYRKMVFTKFRRGGMLARYEKKDINLNVIIQSRS